MHDREASIHYLSAGSAKRCAPYRQLVDQVRNAMVSGLLREGDQLPSLRDVVTQITINPNTVHRAYRELEHLGIAEGRAGLGTFITSYSSRPFDATERESLERKLRDTITEARHFGISEEQILELITLAFVKMATYVHDRRDGRSRDGEPGKALSTKMGLAGLHIDDSQRKGGCPRWTERRGKSTLLRRRLDWINRVLETYEYSENHPLPAVAT